MDIRLLTATRHIDGTALWLLKWQERKEGNMQTKFVRIHSYEMAMKNEPLKYVGMCECNICECSSYFVRF